MGLKQGAIGNTHGEHIGNLLEQRKNEKNPEWMLHLPIGCMQFLFSKLLVTF
jgi:hypothetical protein